MLPNASFVQTGFAGLIEITPAVFPDDRGFFFESATFAKNYSVILDPQRHIQPFVLEGLARGLATREVSVFFYKCSNVFNKNSETGIEWNDPELSIQWPFENPIVSEKNQELPALQELIRNSVI